MADFALSLINPTTGVEDITVASDILSIVDHSNYDTNAEAGHARSDFSDFFKILITLPDADSVLYSSIGDGDEVVTTPSAGDPEIDYPYSSGDGQYLITVYSVPTYNAAAPYLLETAPYVYYNTSIWQLIQDATSQEPAENAYWTEVADIDLLPAKYRVAQKIAIYADEKKYWARKIYQANCVNNKIGDNWEKLLRDPDFIAAVELFIGINSIPVLMAIGRYDEVDITINRGKQICSAGEVL